MASDTTANISNRLSITVPDFDTRLNLGTPDPGGGNPFGYTGFSAHSQYNFFVDIGRVGLYQTNLGSCWQVGGKWLQWSNLDMYLGTTGNSTVSADNKVTIVAGAGQGQVTALTAAASQFESPRLVDYNNLQLHWRVDGVQVALKQFFYGYGNVSTITHALRDSIPKSGVGGKGWREKGAPTQKVQDKYSQPDAGPQTQYPDGGFLADVEKLLTDIGRRDLKPELLRGFEWEGNRMDMGNLTGRKSSYFAMFEPFDPYPPASYSEETPFSSTVAGLTQVINNMRRLVDVAHRILGALTTDNPIGKRALALIQTWQDAQDVVTSIQNLCNDPSQWSRAGGEVSVASAHLPWNAQSEGTVAAATAPTTQTTDGPWNVAAGATLVVTDGTHTLTITFTQATAVTATDLASALGNQAPAGWTLSWASTGQTGNWTASASGSSVTLAGTVTGQSSQLVITGSAKDLFFDESSQDASGTDAYSGAGDSFQRWWDDERSIEISAQSLPEDLRDQARPLYQAMGDFCTALADVDSVVMDFVTGLSTGLIQPPSMLGLIGKDGITLGTNGPLYGSGGGISLVATCGIRDGDSGDGNPAESDDDKYVLLESVVNWALDGDDWAKKLQQKFQRDSDVKKAMRGHFRVAAERDVVLTAQGQIFHVSLSETSLLSKKRASVASSEELSLRSYTKSVEILGPEVRVGSLAPASPATDPTKADKQQPTKKVNVAATDRIDLRTDKVRFRVRGDMLAMGKNDKDKNGIVWQSPHVVIAGSSIAAGYWGDDSFTGLDIEKADGSISLTGKKFAIGVRNGPGMEIGAEAKTVTIHGNLKVGSALIAKDSFTTLSNIDILVAGDGDVPPLKTAAATAYKTVKGLAATKSAALGDPPQDDAPDALKTAYQTKRVELRGLYGDHHTKLEAAKSLEITPTDAGWSPADETFFVQRAPDDKSSGFKGS